MSDRRTPGELTIRSQFSKHLGPRFIGAGLTLQFHYNQPPGIHIKAETLPEYEQAILLGITDSMSLRFPSFLENGSVWVTEIVDHPVDSSQWAFYLAARSAVEQAYALAEPNLYEVFQRSLTP
jgi:hypothetical protein